MIITNFDKPITAEDARKISLSNREDTVDRIRFREIMHQIEQCASFGYTRHITFHAAKAGQHPSERVQEILRSFGYKVVEKRSYEYDLDKKEFSKDKPLLDAFKREQFFLEITWG